MQGFLLKVLVLLFMGLAVGLIASRNTGVRLHMEAPPIRRPQPTPGEQPPAAPTGAQAPAEATAKVGPVPAPQPPAAASAAEGYFISLPEAKKLFDAKQAIFIDARTFAEFKEGHIQGSMHVDKRYFDGAAPKKVRDYLPGQEVVVYCHGAECTDSEAVIKRLQALNLGIGPYHILKDGYPGWKDAGYPVDSGDEVGFQ